MVLWPMFNYLETCNGKRFKRKYSKLPLLEKNINDILTMTIDDAVAFF
jgi:excinuclease ABC subunit A